MADMKRIDCLVSREKRIFKFLVFYLFLAFLLVFLFLNSNGWAFIETAILVLAIEVLVTGFVKRGKPLHTNEDVCEELSKIKEVDEYVELRNRYIMNKDKAITIVVTIYSLSAVILLFLSNFKVTYLTLSITGLMALYFSVYLIFRYKISKVTIILLERRKVISEMKATKEKVRNNKKGRKIKKLKK